MHKQTKKQASKWVLGSLVASFLVLFPTVLPASALSAQPTSIVVSEVGPFDEVTFSDGVMTVGTATAVRVSVSAISEQLEVSNVILAASTFIAFENDVQVTSGNQSLVVSASSTVTLSASIEIQGDFFVRGSAIRIDSQTISSSLGGLEFRSMSSIDVRDYAPSAGAGSFIANQDVVFWSDFDESLDGYIALTASSVIRSDEGKIVLAGGLDVNSDGLPDGYAATNTSTAGLILGRGYYLETGAEDIVLRGKSGRRGLILQDYGEIRSSTGQISISGEAQDNFGSYGFAVYFSLNNVSASFSPHVLVSGNSTPQAISVFGKINRGLTAANSYISAVGTVFGVGDLSKPSVEMRATQAGGGIKVIGVNSSSAVSLHECNQSSDGVRLDFVDFRTVDGDILISGNHLERATSGVGKYDVSIDSCAFGDSLNRPALGKPSIFHAGGSGKLSIIGNLTKIRVPEVTLSGSVVEVAPHPNNSFFAKVDFSEYGFSSSESLFLGGSSNTQDMTLNRALTLSDTLRIQGGEISSSGSIVSDKLAIRSSGLINLGSNNNFRLVEIQNSKSGLVKADINLGLASGSTFEAADVSDEIDGYYGLPKVVSFISYSPEVLEYQPFAISVQMLTDYYGFELDENNQTPVSMTLSILSGASSLSGTTNVTALGGNIYTFSDLVLASVPVTGSSVVLEISGTNLVSTSSPVISATHVNSTNSSLTSVAISSGSLDPFFGSSDFEYSVSLANGVSSITVSALANQPTLQTITLHFSLTSSALVSGESSELLELQVGTNRLIIEVTAEDGSTSSYLLIITRASPESQEDRSPPRESPAQSVGSSGFVVYTPEITSLSKSTIQADGDSFSIFGRRLNLVTTVKLGILEVDFVRLSNEELFITVPAIEVGSHELQLTGDFGRIIEGSPITAISPPQRPQDPISISRAAVAGFVGRSTYLGPDNREILRNFVQNARPGSTIRCVASIPDTAFIADIRLGFKRANRVCDFIQSLNSNIQIAKTWVWRDGNDSWLRANVRLKLD